MDINNNSSYLNILKVNDAADLKTPFVKSNELADSNVLWLPIVKELEIAISIPEGYRALSVEQINVQTSFDQHQLRTVIIKEKKPVDLSFIDSSGNEINLDTSAEIYLVKLVGNLYYNAVTGNYEPDETTYSNRSTKFNSYGAVIMNEALGYATALSDIPANIENSLNFNIVHTPSSVAALSAMSTSSKVSAMQIPNYMMVSYTMVVNVVEGPIS